MGTLLTRITLIDIIILAIGAWPVIHFWGIEVFVALVAGFAVMTVAAVGTFYIAELSYHKSMNQYMLAVFGSMGAKLVFLGAAIVAVFLLELLHGLAFTLGVLFSYIYKSVIEIQLLVKRIKSQQPAEANEANN